MKVGISNEVTIGKQVWMSKNLEVSTFRNGDPIPEAKTDYQWQKARQNGQPAWCYYDNDPAKGEKYGKLYNWYAVNDLRGLAPKGWHIPSNAEWTVLESALGGSSVAGGKLKEAGTTNWKTPNTGAENSSGWTGLPGGARYNDGTFNDVGYSGCWWSTTEGGTSLAWGCGLAYNGCNFGRGALNEQAGFSVRCLRD